MVWRQRIRILCTIALFVLLTTLIWGSSHVIFTVGLVILISAGIIVLLTMGRFELKLAKHKAEQQLIHLVSRYRHDWMNDIQLLFGYVSLKKYDKLMDTLEKIRNKAAQENNVSKLGIPSLVIYFISRQLSANGLLFELKIEQENNLSTLNIDKKKFTATVIKRKKKMIANAVLSDEMQNVLHVHFFLENDALLFEVSYSGREQNANIRLQFPLGR